MSNGLCCSANDQTELKRADGEVDPLGGQAGQADSACARVEVVCALLLTQHTALDDVDGPP
jgi:hypothetical protein